MPLSFHLSASQLAAQENARAFTHAHIQPARAHYSRLSSPKERFDAIRPVIEAATRAGFQRSGIPAELGGRATPLLEQALAIEEFFAVDASVPIAFLSAGLGLAPVIFGGSPEQQEELLAPFVTQEGTPLACLAASEPEGSANYIDNPKLTTAYEDGDDYVINGEKAWVSCGGGWDYNGPDVTSLVCRVIPGPGLEYFTGPKNIAVIAFTRADVSANPEGAYTAHDDTETLGFTAVSGPRLKFTNLRVPKRRLLGKVGQGAELVTLAFAGSACMVGAMACGIMRTAYESALEFCRMQTRGGEKAIVEHQSVADRLIEMKTKLETSRLLTWKACEAFESSRGKSREGCYMAKVYASECAVDVVRLAMAVVGIQSYADRLPYNQLMKDALALPIFDGGNVGVRRRELQALYAADGYNPRSLAFGS